MFVEKCEYIDIKFKRVLLADDLWKCLIQIMHSFVHVRGFQTLNHTVEGFFEKGVCHIQQGWARTEFMSTSTSTCDMCEHEYEYLIETWVQE